MANLLTVGITSGVPSSGTGTVSTIDQLLAVGSPISNGSSSVLVAIAGASSAITSSMNALAVGFSPNSPLPAGANSIGTVVPSSAITVGTITAGTITTVGSLTSGTVAVANGANTAQVLAGSSTITSTMAGLVTVLSPNSAGIITTGTVGAPSSVYLSVQAASNASPIPAADPYSAYTVVGASLTQQSLGSSAGRAGDYLAYVTVFPTIAASGAVTIFDSTAITIGSFAGGATTPLPSLVPFRIDIGAFSVSSGWKVTTSSNVSALGIGKFT
jgi:hypothetical protein